ncbi:MAG TPA: hypothetical protein VHD31_00570 [Candidatus Paceibacterota bacterium]|nr:hypothetical protein [Candidatus Paceibacterota bacterium]
MDLNPIVPQDPQGGSSNTPPAPPVPVPQSGAGGVDLSKILLPKKDAPGKTVDSAQRVSAGALVAQEQTATLPKQPAPAPITPAPEQKKEDAFVKPVETYQGDIEKLVQNKNMSVVSIAAAEAARREVTSLGEEPPPAAPFDWLGVLKRTGMLAGGAVLVVAAIGLILFVLQPPKTVNVPSAVAAPFITIDGTKVLTIAPDKKLTHADVVNALNDERKAVKLPLGLIERLYMAYSSTTASGEQAIDPLSAQEVLQFLSPNVPDTLTRTIDPSEFVLGIHVYEENQPFLILKADSYEQAYAAILNWEPYMQKDLAPLFARTPRLQIMATQPNATTTQSTATSTATTTTTPPVPNYTASTTFIDRIVENHDARVIQDSAGNILLLWSFLDRKTLVITTNEVTLREIISRLKNPPITPLP